MNVLVIGAHCDDIELGAGATIYKHRKDWNIICATFCITIPARINYGIKPIELETESCNAMAILGGKSGRWFDFPNAEFANYRQEIWEELYKLKKEVNPDLVITQHPDEHQDHVTIFENTIRVFKNCSVLTYPLARSSPKCITNYYEVISHEDLNAKLAACKCYTEYQERPYFRPENIEAMARYYGIYIEKEFAEGFFVERIIR